MRSILTILLFTFIFGNQLSAQLQMGMKIGVAASNLKVKCLDNANCFESSLIPGPIVGLTATYTFNDKFAIQPELFYILKGFNERGQFRFSHIVNYVALPILASYKISPKISILGGPELSYEFSHFIWDQFSLRNESLFYQQKGDFGISIGLNYMISERLSMDIRYNEGVSLRSLTSRLKYRSLYLSIKKDIW